MKVYCKHYAPRLTVGQIYDVLEEDSQYYDVVNDEGTEEQYFKCFFGVAKEDETPVSASTEITNIDKHYSFFYELSVKDIKAGVLKVDPYFVAKQWQIGAKDPSGVLFHCLKNLARFGDKNSREREITALYKQVIRLAELEGVELKS